MDPNRGGVAFRTRGYRGLGPSAVSALDWPICFRPRASRDEGGGRKWESTRLRGVFRCPLPWPLPFWWQVQRRRTEVIGVSDSSCAAYQGVRAAAIVYSSRYWRPAACCGRAEVPASLPSSDSSSYRTVSGALWPN
ncbi:hypothetical protein NDU88_008062 [Pleurodeles waltl]|uniref:Uncharacterized protein n=1 Tax=Pleurodeles waltl TaxID=8319 RepID=A0AAV7P2K4_PLEWA|nr:hypothetical protein NDU88_008062 [Pleurodeles waltl]